MDDFSFGFLCGVLVFPLITFIEILGKIFSNAWKATHSCGGDCEQGRKPCNCKKEENGS